MKGQKLQKIVFRAEMRFEGEIEEFIEMGEVLERIGIVVRPIDWPRGHRTCGCWPSPIEDLTGMPYLEGLVKGAPRFRMPEFIAKDICGGIRVAHVHLPSDEIALLDRQQFADLAGRVAAQVMERVGDSLKYPVVTSAMRALAGESN